MPQVYSSFFFSWFYSLASLIITSNNSILTLIKKIVCSEITILSEFSVMSCILWNTSSDIQQSWTTLKVDKDQGHTNWISHFAQCVMTHFVFG